MAKDHGKILEKAVNKGGEENSRPTTPVSSVPFPTGAKNDGLADYVNAVYEASENARTAQLEAAYNKAASDLAAARQASDAQYSRANAMAQRGAARQAAGFRELANARGLNSGAVGQAAMMQSNALQNDLSSIGRAQAQTDGELERRRAGLARSYALQRQRLMAENEYNRNAALYGELVRNDEAKRQQEQFRQQVNLQMMQMAMAEQKKRAAEAAKAAKNAGGYEFGDTTAAEKLKDNEAYDLAKQYLEANVYDGGYYLPMTYEQWQNGAHASGSDTYGDYVRAHMDYEYNRAKERGAAE